MVRIRLGPLSIEQKKRAVVKRATLQKDERDKKKPQEITENDITRSENETTKNVATVRPPSHPLSLPPVLRTSG